MLENERAFITDKVKLEEIRLKLNNCNENLDADDKFALQDDGGEDTEEADERTSINVKPDIKNIEHKHKTLKGSCPTRWNSVLIMIESILDV